MQTARCEFELWVWRYHSNEWERWVSEFTRQRATQLQPTLEGILGVGCVEIRERAS